ncbi:MAG: hypothetical protein ACREOZ_00370 [Gloeomargaritales cyanobacterium]
MGLAHPVCCSYRHFIQEWHSSAPLLELEWTRDPLYPSKLLRAVQLELVEWFGQQEKLDAVLPSPALQNMFQKIRLQQWIPPNLPYRLGFGQEERTRLGLDATATSTREPPSVQHPPTVVSTITGATGVGTMAPSNKNKQRASTFVRNTINNPELQVSNTFKLKPITDEHAPHNNDKGDQMCVSYHCKGSCYANCNRASDHRVHTVAEDAKLLRWKREHFQKGGANSSSS